MRVVDEKLERFAHEIMADVEAKRQKIFEEVEKNYKEIYDKSETEYLTEAYKIIQNGLKSIDKEKNEVISKAIMENKTRLLNKRTELIQGIFEHVKDQLRAFTKEKEYYDYLAQMIKDAIIEINEGDIEIYISATDEAYLDALKKEFPYPILLEDKKIDMIGGCKVYNKDTNIFIDDSFARRLEDQREPFLQRCKMDIE